MLRYQAGEKEAFRLLYFRYHARLHRFVAHLLANNRGEAEDVFQETWLAVIHGKERYAGTAKFVTYLFSIAHRRVADRWRKQYRQVLRERPLVGRENIFRVAPTFSKTGWRKY
jgi:RNA polymerase sigma-70 factor (ECF subfamily)